MDLDLYWDPDLEKILINKKSQNSQIPIFGIRSPLLMSIGMR